MLTFAGFFVILKKKEKQIKEVKKKGKVREMREKKERKESKEESKVILLDVVSQKRKEVSYEYLSRLTGYSEEELKKMKEEKKELERIKSFIIRKGATRKEIKEVLKKVIEKEYRGEVWSKCSILEESYEVSSLGRLRKKSEKGLEVVTNTFRKLSKGKRQIDVKVRLRGGEYKYITLKKLVYATYAPKEYREDLPIVHRDKDIYNCRYTNLRMLTRKELAILSGGVNCEKAKKVVMLDQTTYKPLGVYESQREVARRLGVKATNITRAIKYRKEKENPLSVASGYRFYPLEEVEREVKKTPNIKYYRNEKVNRVRNIENLQVGYISL